MWLRAAGVKNIPAASGLSFNNMHLALDAAIAGHGVVLAYSTIAAADLFVAEFAHGVASSDVVGESRSVCPRGCS